MSDPEKEESLSPLARLRSRMKEEGIDAYIVPTEDFHASEYIGEHFACRKYLTGFTGSAGTALVCQDFAGLWTDGRYFLQAEAQLKGSGFTLMKMDEKGVPSLFDFVTDRLISGQVLGFDGRVVSASDAKRYEEAGRKKGFTLRLDCDLVGEIWQDRPSLSAEPIWSLDVSWCGQDRKQKIKKVREELEKGKAEWLFISCLDDIAWLLNLRGNDIPCNPVFLSYLAMNRKECFLFVREGTVSPSLRKELEDDGISLRAYEDIYAFAGSLEPGTSVRICLERTNSRLVKSFPASVTIRKGEHPTTAMKAVKNETELENMKQAHVKDGVAVTRFLYWLKQTVGVEPVTELSAARKLYELRCEQEHFMGNSFAPIIAFGSHAAIIHYSATDETDVSLERKGLLLADTGGQYLEGTTDITRTIVLGPVSEKEKRYFTAVLKGHLALMAAVFREGCGGYDLDILARQPLWEMGVDYNHGTGHGVGYFLNVHEGPQRIHYKIAADKPVSAVLEPGMIISDEPGFYLPGEFGIRHENLLACKVLHQTEFGTFLGFEPLTVVPFDLEGILPDLLTGKEKELLNTYHEKVYETIASYLSPEERQWLKKNTESVK